MQIRILLADDFPAVRRAIRSILELRKEWEIVAEAQDGQEAVAKAQQHHPDVAVLDISMPVMNGLEVARQLHELLPETEILILTQHTSREMLRQAVKMGARGYVVKSTVARELIPAIEAMIEHRTFVGSNISN